MSNCKYIRVGALLAMAVCWLVVGQGSAMIVKRSFVKLGCQGEYDKSMFATLDRICEECFNLYREAGLHALCRADCFSNTYFKGCTKALLLSDRESELQGMVNRLYGVNGAK